MKTYKDGRKRIKPTKTYRNGRKLKKTHETDEKDKNCVKKNFVLRIQKFKVQIKIRV